MAFPPRHFTFTIYTSFSPAMGFDPTSWEVAIGADGSLIQKVRHYAESNWRTDFEYAAIGPEAVACLLSLAEQIGFWSLEEMYVHPATDLASYRIDISLGDTSKTVDGYGASILARAGNQDMKQFMELWHSIHIHAPHQLG